MSTEPERNADSVRVLIVDDHPLVRAGLRAMLNRPDIEVVADAATGSESVALAVELKPDVVIMDVVMPDMDGFEATAEIKRRVSTTSVIVMTGLEDDDFLRRAIEAGASGYLLKGAPREMLLQSVRLLKAGGSLIDREALLRLAQLPNPKDEPTTPSTPAHLLSPREVEVLRLIIRGSTNKEIAAEMHYSVGTVKNVVQRVIEKLGVSDRTQAAVLAVRAGLDVEGR